jgi:Gram-negative bacterial TonB protein C-terminal
MFEALRQQRSFPLNARWSKLAAQPHSKRSRGRANARSRFSFGYGTMARLTTLLLIVLLAHALSAAQPTPTRPQPWINVSAQRAAQHLIRSGQPVYPKFALAAGIEGTVRVCVEIGKDGQLGMAGGDDTGPPALRDAAVNALGGFAYRPFLVGGVPVSAQTVVAIPFKLPPEIPARTYPMPRLELSDFDPQAPSGDLVSLSSLPPSLSKWYRSHVVHESQDYPDDQKQDFIHEYLQGTSVRRIFKKSKGAALYLFHSVGPEICGATGNCPMLVVEYDGQTATLAVDGFAWGYTLRQRKGAAFPDIFFSGHFRAGETSVVGYGEAGGLWGPLYQRILTDE